MLWYAFVAASKFLCPVWTKLAIYKLVLQEDAFAEATAGAEEEEIIPELGLDKKKKKKKKREVSCQVPCLLIALNIAQLCAHQRPSI